METWTHTYTHTYMCMFIMYIKHKLILSSLWNTCALIKEATSPH